MSSQARPALTHPPAPRARHVRLAQIAIAIAAGPLAWFTLVCAGEVLADEPCFPDGHRFLRPVPALQWTWPALIVLLALCALLALASFLLAFKLYRATRSEEAGRPGGLLDEGVGRTRFMALWGLLYGAGFCIATLFSLAAFVALPRCAG